MPFYGQGAWTRGTDQTFPTNVSNQTITGIPSTASRFRIKFFDISSSGAGYVYMRVGHSGGMITSNYYGNSNYHYYSNTDSTGSAFNDRIGLSSSNWDAANYTWCGFIEFEKIKTSGSSNIWLFNNSVFETSGGYWSSHRIMYEGRGFAPLGSNTLDRIAVYITSGNFDNGTYILDYLV
tara:strand:- start:974 stop:1510 length:537 start_codon:yes stop_codon:yes gene_type:complete